MKNQPRTRPAARKNAVEPSRASDQVGEPNLPDNNRKASSAQGDISDTESCGGKHESDPNDSTPDQKLLDKFLSCQRDLELATADNEQLKDENKALHLISDYNTQLQSILTKYNYSSSLLPSSQLAPRPMDAANHLVDAIWEGHELAEQSLGIFERIGVEGVFHIDVNFRTRLQIKVGQWREATPTARLQIEKAIVNTLRERCKIATMLALNAPLMLLEICKKEMPAAIHAQHAKQHLSQLVSQLNVSPHQRQLITEIWRIYFERMELINARIAAARLALAHGGSSSIFRDPFESQIEPSTHSSALTASYLKTYTDDLHAALSRAVDAYQRLFKSSTYVLNLRQYAVLSLGMRHYGMASPTDWCEIVASSS